MTELPIRIIDVPENEEFRYILEKNASRRQMTQKKISYLRGKLYLTKKGDGSGKKSEQIAEESGVSEKTVRRDANYAKDMEALSETDKKIKDKILNNEIKATKEDIAKVVALPKEEQKKVIEKTNETKDITTALEEIQGSHQKGDKIPNLAIETLKAETKIKLEKVEKVLINKTKEIDKKKKLHSAFQALNRKIDKILQ